MGDRVSGSAGVVHRFYHTHHVIQAPQRYFPVRVHVFSSSLRCIMAELVDGQPLFPGESDIDQLYIIQRLVGNLTMEQHTLFLKNSRWVGVFI